MKGHEYKGLVARYLLSAYAGRGLELFDEMTLGTSIIGKPRRVDLFLLQRASGKALVLECKYQDTAGTVDEKIPYALADLAALRLPSVLVYAGTGYSDGVLHLLKSSPQAAYCLPSSTLEVQVRSRSSDAIHTGTWQLDHVLAQTFGFWDVLVGRRAPMVLSSSAEDV